MERPSLALDAVLEALPDAVVVVDAGRLVVRANERAEALFGYPPGAMLGEHVDLLLPDEHPTSAGAGREPAPRGVVLEMEAVRADGSRLPVELRLSPLEDPGGPLTLAVVRDIADRHRAERLRVRADQEAAVSPTSSPRRWSAPRPRRRCSRARRGCRRCSTPRPARSPSRTPRAGSPSRTQASRPSSGCRRAARWGSPRPISPSPTRRSRSTPTTSR